MTHRFSHATMGMLAMFTTTVLAVFTPSVPAALAAAPEAPVTEAATGVNATEATLHGELNPGASATTGYEFSYNTNGTCTEGPVTEPQPEQTGEAIKVESLLTGLVPSTEYTFCVLATHLEGETTEATSGAPLSFKTSALAPEVASQSSSSILPFSAAVQAEVNPENQPTTSCVFEYGTTMLYGSSQPCEPETLEGFGGQSVSHALSGLEAGTTYHFRTVVENATGKTEGPDQEFTTLPAEAPVIANESATEVGTTVATLLAKVNPSNQETTYVFEYATEESMAGATVIPGAAPLPPVGEERSVGLVHLTGLAPVTIYYYRVSATNSTGTTQGPVQQLHTTGVPLASTGAPGTVSRTTAAISGGTITPQGAETTYHYAFSDRAAYEAKVAESAPDPYVAVVGTHDQSAGSDYTEHTVAGVTITELRPGTTYHYALIATNSVGRTIGTDMLFTTSPGTPPAASTGGAEGVSWNEATITGSVDTRGLSTTIQFELATTPGGGVFTVAEPSFAQTGTIAVSAHLGPYLQPDTTYYYRTVATNTDGTSIGPERSFITGSFPGSPGTTPPPVQLVAFPGFVAAELAAGIPGTTRGATPKSLTKRQKLAKALKACAKRKGHQRASCRRLARKKYA